MLKLMYKINRILKYINKNNIHLLYILSLIYSILAKLRNNKFTKIINWIIKLILKITLITSRRSRRSSRIFYRFNTPINNTYTIYLDFLKPYIEYLINL